MRSRRSLVVLATLGLCGCSLLVSTSGLTSDGPAPSPDASDAPIDAATEAVPTDAPVADVDAGTKSPCSIGTHLFCDDFDRTSAPQSGWSNLDLTTKGSLSLSPARAVSAPNALLTKLPRRNSPDDAEYAVLRHMIQKSFSKVIVAYDMFIEKPAFMDGDINAGTGCFYVRNNNMRGATCMSVGADYAVIFDAQLGPWPFETWVHVVLTMPTQDVPTVSLTSNVGTKTVQGKYDLTVEVGEPMISIEIGLQGYNKPAPGFTVYYDNVVVDTQ